MVLTANIVEYFPPRPFHIGTGSVCKARHLIGSPMIVNDGLGRRRREHTGMPQLVDIPAPVIMTIFFDEARILAIFCSSRFSSCVTWMIGMVWPWNADERKILESNTLVGTKRTRVITRRDAQGEYWWLARWLARWLEMIQSPGTCWGELYGSKEFLQFQKLC